MSICEHNGWTYADWKALPESEQTDRLAFRYRRQQFLDGLLDGFDKRIANEQSIEQTAYILTLMERFAA